VGHSKRFIFTSHVKILRRSSCFGFGEGILYLNYADFLENKTFVYFEMLLTLEYLLLHFALCGIYRNKKNEYQRVFKPLKRT